MLVNFSLLLNANHLCCKQVLDFILGKIRVASTFHLKKPKKYILLNKSLARILISYPGLNEYEIFYLVLINKYGDLKINVFRNRQTKRNLDRRQWIDVTF